MKKIYAIGMLCVLAASCLSCRKQVERIEYLPNYHQMYLFQNKSSSDYVLFRIYSSGPGGRAEDGFSEGKAIRMIPITMFTRSTARIRSTCCRMRPRTIRPYPTARYMSSSVPAMREACTTMRFGKKRIIGSS